MLFTAEDAVVELKKLADETGEVTDEFKRYYMPVDSQSVSSLQMTGVLKNYCSR